MSNDLNRRKYLQRLVQASVIGGSVGFAGCGGDGGGDGGGGDTPTATDSPTDESDGGTPGGGTPGGGTSGDTSSPTATDTPASANWPIDASFSAGTGVVPSQGQFNPYNAKQLLISPNNTPNLVLYDDLWKTLPQTGEDYMKEGTILTGREYDPDNKTVTLNIRDDARWHNGDTYKARDLVTHYKLNQYINNALSNVTEISAVDEKTVELSLKDVVNTGILWDSLALEANVKHSMFKQYLQRLEDAGSQSKRNQVIADIQSYRIEKAVGTGPFQYDRANGQRLVLTNFEDYHRPVPFTEYVYKYLPDLNSVVSAFLGGDLDGQAHMSAPESTQQQLPDHIVKIQAGTASGGWGLTYNLNRDFLGQRKVRQAMAHLIDRRRIAENTLPAHSYVKHAVGLTNKNAANYLGDRLNEYERYEGNNTEKAMSLLEEAGYSKQKGTVVDSKGEPVKFNFLSPTWTNPSRVAETVKAITDDFGLNMQISTQPGTQFRNRRSKGDFDMTVWYWWAPHPYTGYQRAFVDRKDAIHNKQKIAVPPIGKPDGTRSTVDVVKLQNQLYTETDPQQAKEIVQQIAWVYNRYLPTIPATQGVSTSYIATDDWQIPSKDSKHYDPFYPNGWWPKVGELVPKTSK
ncbi:MAG: ABC transporter substrate-binding protein [Halanaeroarchaeum sp.]